MTDGQTAHTPAFRCPASGQAPVYYVHANDRTATAQVQRVTENAADSAARNHGTPGDVSSGGELPIPVGYPLRVSRLELVNSAGGTNRVTVDVDTWSPSLPV